MEIHKGGLKSAKWNNEKVIMSAPIYRVSDWQSESFDMIIDVRSPEEFQIDHIPCAVNMPVLTDNQRNEVGKIYKEISPFEARKLGASYVSKNISAHIENRLLTKNREFKPLIYCWRGGQRSAAFSSVLSEIGWQTYQLEGGYKTYRKGVISKLNNCSYEIKLIRIAGYTGAGKTKLLHLLRQKGKQVIDLEQIAGHRGSLLGEIKNKKQPSQKQFEGNILSAIQKMSTAQHVFVEAESSTIGNLMLPAPFWKKLKSAPFIWLEVPLTSRSKFLLEEYAWLTEGAETLKKLAELIKRKGNLKLAELVAEDINRCDWKSVAENLLSSYYDCRYKKSLQKSPALKIAEVYQDNCSDSAVNATADKIISLLADRLF